MSDVINMNEVWHVLLHYLQMWIYGYMSRVIHTNESCHSYKRVMSYIRTSHVIYTNESCHSYERVMSLIRTSHFTHTNVSCHWHERVMSLTQTSHVTHTNESSHSHERVMCLKRTSHVIHTNESCHGYKRVIACAATIHRRRNTDTCRLPATSSLATALPRQVPQQIPSYYGKTSTHWVYADVCPYLYSKGPGTPSPMNPLRPPSALTLTQDWFVLKSLSTEWDIHSGIWMSQSVWHMDDSWVPTPPLHLFSPYSSFWSLCLPNESFILASGWYSQSDIWMTHESRITRICTPRFFLSDIWRMSHT